MANAEFMPSGSHQGCRGSVIHVLLQGVQIRKDSVDRKEEKEVSGGFMQGWDPGLGALESVMTQHRKEPLEFGSAPKWKGQLLSCSVLPASFQVTV